LFILVNIAIFAYDDGGLIKTIIDISWFTFIFGASFSGGTATVFSSAFLSFLITTTVGDPSVQLESSGIVGFALFMILYTSAASQSGVWWHDLNISRRMMSKVIESNLDAVMVAKLGSSIVSWSHGAELTFGYTKEEAIGSSIRDLMIPESEFERFPIMIEDLRSGKIVGKKRDTTYKKKSGEIITVEQHFNTFTVGNDVMVVMFARDVTVERARTLFLEAMYTGVSDNAGT